MEPAASRTAWVTGAGGLIGSHIARFGSKRGEHGAVVGLTRQALDLQSFAEVERKFRAERPDLVVHCAALSRSPECQADPARAWRINFECTKFLAELASGIRFIFFSTDLVFDGQRGDYRETDMVNPLSTYGETKAAAERAVLANPRHIVVRTSLTAGASPTGDRGLDEQLRRAWSRGETTRLFVDEFRSPIAAEVTARAVWDLAESAPGGIYHVAGSQKLSRWEIGELIAARSPELTPRLESASLREYRGAPRAPDTSLNCAKAQQALPFPIPGFRDWLTRHTPADV